MQLKEFPIILNIKDPVRIAEHIEFVQGDSNSSVLNITLVDGLVPYNLTGATVKINFRKADKTTVQQTDLSGIGIMDETKGMVRCILKTNSIACPGRVLAEVEILDGEMLLTSALFYFNVRRSLVNDETIESTNEFPILTELINTTEDLIDRVEGIEEQVPENVISRIEGIENSKIDKANIVQNATSTNPETVASGPVARELQRQITEQNNNLAERTLDIGNMVDSNILSKIINVSKPSGSCFTGTLNVSGQGRYGVSGYVYQSGDNHYGTITRTHYLFKQVEMSQINNSVMSDWNSIATWT